MPLGVYPNGNKGLFKKGHGLVNGGFSGHRHTDESKEKMKEKRKLQDMSFLIGREKSEETRKKLSEARKGKPRPGNPENWKHSEETKKILSEKSSQKKGENASNWKGGVTPINFLIRSSREYKLWRKSVFERDNYTCIWCGDNKGGNLNADHIKPFAHFPELRFAIDNGRTLCVPCHKTTDTFGSRINKKYE